MARTRKITDEQILEAAQAVFLEQGTGASTLAIAERAGISEASIFKRFSTKENLFFKSMGLPGVPPWLPFLEETAGQGDLQDNLKTLGLRILEFFKENLPKIIMLMSKGVLVPDEIMSGESSPPMRNLRALTQFFATEMSVGRIRQQNPRMVAIFFMSGLKNYVMLSRMSAPLPEPEAYVEAMVEIFLGGVGTGKSQRD